MECCGVLTNLCSSDDVGRRNAACRCGHTGAAMAAVRVWSGMWGVAGRAALLLAVVCRMACERFVVGVSAAVQL